MPRHRVECRTTFVQKNHVVSGVSNLAYLVAGISGRGKNKRVVRQAMAAGRLAGGQGLLRGVSFGGLGFGRLVMVLW